MRGREAEERDILEEEEVKEERRREEVRGAAGGVARDRRAKAEPDRRAFIVGMRSVSARESVSASFSLPVWLGYNSAAVRSNTRGSDIRQKGTAAVESVLDLSLRSRHSATIGAAG